MYCRVHIGVKETDVEAPPNSEELWRLALEHSPVGMSLIDPGGRILVVNRALCDMLGHEEEDLLARSALEFTHPDDDEGHVHFGRALAGEIDSYRLRKRYRHADGSTVWGDLSVALVRRPDGSPLHFISQVLDITEQRRAEERLAAANAELERERKTLEAIFDTVNVGLLLIDRKGRYERMNRRHRETMSLPFPDGHAGAAGQLGHVYFLDGKTLMSREDMPTYRAMHGEEFDGLRYWVGGDPASRAAYSTSARSLRDENGEFAGAVLAYQDITDLMLALQIKEEFVSSVSHELRTPLTSVLGHLEMLSDREDLPVDVMAGIEVVERNAVRLQTLVSDLLDVARAREEALALEHSRVDISALVHEAVEAALPVAEASGISLEVEAPEAVTFLVDGERIRQVLDNLISNGIKYADEGGTVTVVVVEDADRLAITVRDTGIGISEAEVEQVFTRFFRGGGALQRHVPGTGIGLNIVSTIVAAHGGRVGVESKVGEGSAFTVELPRQEA